MNEIQLEQKLLDQIKDIKDRYDELTVIYGSLTLQRKAMEEKIKETDVQYNLVRKDEIELLTDLQATHGEGMVNADAGVYIKR